MNATLQCLKVVPELRGALREYVCVVTLYQIPLGDAVMYYYDLFTFNFNIICSYLPSAFRPGDPQSIVSCE